MAQPVKVRATQVVNLLSKRRFLVQWQLNPELDIDQYNIYRSENQFTGFEKVGQVSSESTQFIDTVPFTFGINFFWKVTAVNTADEESDLTNAEAVNDITIGRFDEEPFKQVTLQKTDLVFNEVPSGTKDGVNAVFTTLNPFRTDTTQVYLNGILQILGTDYTENTSQTGITFLTIIPISTDDLRINYVKFC